MEAINNHGLEALVWIANHYQKNVTKEQLMHAIGMQTISPTDLELRECAQVIGYETQQVSLTYQQLAQIPLPALIFIDQQWHILTQNQPLTVMSAQGSEIVQWQDNNQLEYPVLLIKEQLEPEQKRAFGIGWFIPSIIRQRFKLKNIFILAAIVQLFALISPLLFQNLIDKVLVGRSLPNLHILALGILAIAIAEPIYSFIRNKIFSHTSSQISAELSGKIYRHLMALPLNYFTLRPTGKIIARVRELAHIRQFLTGSTLMLFIDFIFVILFIAVLFSYSSIMTWLLVGSMGVFFILWMILGPVIRQQTEKSYQADENGLTFLTESISGIETIKTTATEKYFYQRWQKILSKQLTQNFKVSIRSVIATQLMTLVSKITTALLLWIGVKEVLNGNITPGELVAYNMLSAHVTQPVLRFAQIWQDFQHTIISLRRVGDILDKPIENERKGIASSATIQGQIEFQNIRFRYQPETPEVLNNLSLSIKAGEFIGITGPSGSGKSTLTKLLQRLYIPQHGQVIVDGMDLAVADTVALRRRMSVVLQESTLFVGTIAENIRLSLPQASDEQIIRAAKLAGAYDFIMSLPDNFNYPLSEKGLNLSGGQRQRIALARALLTEPDILILDEATSALDYESESAIMANMPMITEGRTVISIAHRLNTIMGADKIYVIRDGEVAEADTHQNLLKRNGIYASLWRQQTH
ncbi:Alpha-hemolysin translocation ATP-binding protein HlyB [Providencia rustigianii]|uniref:Alpha-hemolysin translocation ATP-binding protein HlyB n=3 Tax=Providencia rustigianii TaxID=158850 RepID=D1P022_9GAMM|nr:MULTISPECIES: type I secretion system permease/ATPase [Providencia]EFB73438.1 type I secretion system ATPase [Providencia rustigianii DSM 4541]SPY77056.1 Alpha-hemolysin translocation ATP-binding protein HlyB [Providencia rustigianii]SUC34996.1 Alpha-hemolysin translocation ATP-binding protein HlyB [Providencia rustigianii]VEB67858.1 Alpha-hemolysin translocation ATP-binding protein HlyB [Providencia rustigianii]